MTDYQLIKKSGRISISANDLVLADHPTYLSFRYKQTVFFKSDLILKDKATAGVRLRELKQPVSVNAVAVFPPLDHHVFKYPLFLFPKGYYYTQKQENQYEFNLNAKKIV